MIHPATKLTLLVLLSMGGTAHADQKHAGAYVFVPNTDRLVTLYSGDWFLLGKLDSNGTFHVERVYSARRPHSGRSAPLINIPARNGEKNCEFRSRRLIVGEITKDGRFVPDLGSEVLDFKDYKYSPDAIKIYNLPGYFRKVVPTKEKSKK